MSNATVREDLKTKGFSEFDLAREIPLGLDRIKQLQELEDVFDDHCELDKYVPETNRYRLFEGYTITGERGVEPAPQRCYVQDAGYNATEGGIPRRFARLPEHLRKQKLLMDIIKYDFSQAPFHASDLLFPVSVGVHFLRLKAYPGSKGVAAPGCLHKDGEPYGFLHLVKRDGVRGGENVIADNDKNVLFTTTLLGPLHSLAYSDAKVYHDVAPVVADGVDVGVRDIIVVDFTPLKPALLTPPKH